MGRTGPQRPAADNPWDLLLRNSVALDLEDKSLDGEYSLRLAGFQYLVYRYVYRRSLALIQLGRLAGVD